MPCTAVPSPKDPGAEGIRDRLGGRLGRGVVLFADPIEDGGMGLVRRRTISQ